MHFRTRRLTVTNSHLVVQSLDGDGNSLVMHAGEHGEVRAQVRRYGGCLMQSRAFFRGVGKLNVLRCATQTQMIVKDAPLTAEISRQSSASFACSVVRRVCRVCVPPVP